MDIDNYINEHLGLGEPNHTAFLSTLTVKELMTVAYNQALEDAAEKKQGLWDLEDKGVWATTVKAILSLKKNEE